MSIGKLLFGNSTPNMSLTILNQSEGEMAWVGAKNLAVDRYAGFGWEGWKCWSGRGYRQLRLGKKGAAQWRNVQIRPGRVK